jgi:peptide/nickel transport system permease protein
VLRYILSRVAQGILTAFVLVTLVFVFARLTGTPVDLLVPAEATPAQREAAIQRLGLDQPLYVQYRRYMGALLTGDFGDSIKFRRPVIGLFLERFPNTIRLSLVALCLATVIGIPLGILSATRRGTVVDDAARGISVVGMSAPDFWVGVMLITVFAVHLGWLPVARLEGPISYVLPAVTMSFAILAGMSRLVRSSLIDVLAAEYIKLARMKGASNAAVVWKHALPNAMLPVLTFFGVNLVGLINGSVAIEAVFAWPGVGRLVYEGIVGRDYPLVQGSLLILGFLVICINLVVDIIYAYVDPRIRFARSR